MNKLFIDSAIKELNAWSLGVVILFVFELVRMSCWLSSLEIHKKVGQTCSKNSSPTLSWVFFFAGVVTGHNLMENMSLSEIYDFSLKNPMETGRTRTVLVLFVTLYCFTTLMMYNTYLLCWNLFLSSFNSVWSLGWSPAFLTSDDFMTSNEIIRTKWPIY